MAIMIGNSQAGRLAGNGLSWLFLLLLIVLLPISPALAQEAGEIISLLGTAEVWREGRWQPVEAGVALAAGETVRTGEGSRVAVLLANGAQLKLNANSRLELKPPAPKPEGFLPTTTEALRSVLRVLNGEIWVRNGGEPLEIQTVPATASIRGTEFTLAVDPGDVARLAVLAGLVEFSNPQGSVLVAANEQATVKLGEAPRKTVLLNPLDAVQWSLYYPDPVGGRTERARDPQSPRYWIQAAQTALLRGEVPQARQALDRALALDPKNVDAYSLRSTIALVQNQKAEARADAERAITADPASSAGWLSLSYVQQAEFDLDAALASARKAVKLDPRNVQALAQESSLLFGMGRLRDAVKVAERARRQAPDDAMVNTIWGFLQLARLRIDEARDAFQAAIAQDSTLGLPHLGLGLVLFRRNQTDAAVAEMRQATLLEPLVSLYNSYLGKAFYEIKDDRRAQKYLEAAKQLDPHDPTPWLYNAIRLQSINRPGEALENARKSIELNDNRMVYRSRLLLDDDRATREATLAGIYENLGFEQLAQEKATQSLSLDPTNYSAHRFLSDSYVGQPGYEIAQVSELLQAQLLQPININPIQPSLVATNLNILARTGLTQMAFNEYMSLFERDQTQLYVSGVGGNNGTWGDEVVVSGLNGPFSYSLGQFHYQTDGFRPNNDFRHDLYNVFVQAAITPEFNVQAEYRHRQSDYGYLNIDFDGGFDPTSRDSLNEDIGRIGARYSPSPQNTFITSLIYADRDHPFSYVTKNGKFELTNQIQGWQGELQWLYKGDSFNAITGMGIYRDEFYLYYLGQAFNEFPTDHKTVYGYTNVQLTKNIVGTLGLAYDAYDSQNFSLNQLNPKIGLRWDITNNLALRAAAFEVVKRDLLVNQTVEPTQVAGFNQFFDDINGTSSKNHGIGLDARFTRTLFGGVELMRRDLDMPSGGGPGSFGFEKLQIDLARVYLNWLADWNWSVTLEYLYQGLTTEGGRFTEGGQFLQTAHPTQLDTSTAPLHIRYFDPSGFFAGAGATYVYQHVDYDPEANPAAVSGDSDFVLFDATVGYRLPKRWGILALEGRNLTDKHFQYQDYNFLMASNSLNPQYLPERTVLGRFILNF